MSDESIAVEVVPADPKLEEILAHSTAVAESPAARPIVTGAATATFTPRNAFFPKVSVFIGAGDFGVRYTKYLEKTFSDAFSQVSSPIELQDPEKLHLHKAAFMQFCQLVDRFIINGERFTVMVNNKAELAHQETIRRVLLAFLESKRPLVEPVMYLFR